MIRATGAKLRMLASGSFVYWPDFEDGRLESGESEETSLSSVVWGDS